MSFVLPTTVYRPHNPPQARKSYYRSTIIEDEPQDSQLYVAAQHKSSRLSTIVDDTSDDDNDALFQIQLQRNPRQARSKPAAFNDLYDVTDDEADEADEIPIRVSVSIFNTPTQAQDASKRCPPIVIPSPSAWPTIQKLQKGDTALMLSPDMLSPPIVSPTPRALSKLAARTFDDSSSRAPSLDGSLTSEELSNLSCPSTPDIERADNDWSAPVQLHPQSLQTLDTLTGVENYDHSPIMYVTEMREVVEQRPQLGLDVTVAPIAADPAELSALSVPSPGGFFSTLEPSTRHAWLPAPTEQPSTSIAENFYNVPWVGSTAEPLEQICEIDLEDNITEGPVTARWNPLTSPRFVLPAVQDLDVNTTDIFPEPVEYNETYQDELREVSTANLDRTTLWLQSQMGFSSKHDADLAQGCMSAPLPSIKKDSISSFESVMPPTPSKSVRFTIEEPVEEVSEKAASPADSTFVQSFGQLNATRNASDAFIHRKTRAEALRLDRKCLFPTHVKRLEGVYEARNEERAVSTRPHSDFFTGEISEESNAITVATQQRRALEQVKPIAWNLEATKMLNGGTLLTSPTGKLFPKIDNGRVLDLGGQASCDWAWQVAFEYPSSDVCTVYTEDQTIDPTIQSPANHKQMRVPNLWTLPYPNDHFHLISARSLFSHLKTQIPLGKAGDEYDLVLRECMRVLKPGGYLEFALLDADIVSAGPQGSALSVEFCFNLRTRGYDCTPTKQWLPRLRRAGFAQVRRAWLSLPLAQAPEAEGSTADVSHITSLVGSWAWERWMLKLHKEMGKAADRLLEGVPAALEEGGRNGASWRYLSGWARKPM